MWQKFCDVKLQKIFSVPFQIQLTLQKELATDSNGNALYETDENGDQQLKYLCGFRIGGGVDQDCTQSPQKYSDCCVYVTHVSEGGPADRCGLQVNDKLLEVNGVDFTVLTHLKAIECLKREAVVNILVSRKQSHSAARFEHSNPQYVVFGISERNDLAQNLYPIATKQCSLHSQHQSQLSPLAQSSRNPPTAYFTSAGLVTTAVNPEVTKPAIVRHPPESLSTFSQVRTINIAIYYRQVQAD